MVLPVDELLRKTSTVMFGLAVPTTCTEDAEVCVVLAGAVIVGALNGAQILLCTVVAPTLAGIVIIPANATIAPIAKR